MKPWHAVIGLTLAVTTIAALPVMAGAVEAESGDTAVSQLAYRGRTQFHHLWRSGLDSRRRGVQIQCGHRRSGSSAGLL